MSKEFNKLTQNIGQAIETIPELYQDGLQPTVQETGKIIARIPRAINAAFSGLDKWILNKEFSIEETKKLLTAKFKNVTPEKIVEPEPYVAIPAIQAISYSMNSKELRNLYANLLAKSMNSDTKDFVHPSFVEIIKQMSPNDANIFKIMYESEYTPLIDLSIVSCEGGHGYYAYNISWITSYSYDTVRDSIDNLLRLGLIEIPYGMRYVDDKIYDMIRNTVHYKELKEKLLAFNIGHIDEGTKYLKCTGLSSSFYKICVKD